MIITHNQVNHFTSAEQASAYDTAREVMSAVEKTADIFREADNTSVDRNKDVGVVVLTGYKKDELPYDGYGDLDLTFGMVDKAYSQIWISGEATFDAKTGSMKTLRSEAREADGVHSGKYTCSFSSNDKEERYTALGGLTVRRDKATDTLYIETARPVDWRWGCP